ncbi:MAG: hypothetical protein WAW90_02985 [Minisyncoccia bacterium]
MKMSILALFLVLFVSACGVGGSSSGGHRPEDPVSPAAMPPLPSYPPPSGEVKVRMIPIIAQELFPAGGGARVSIESLSVSPDIAVNSLVFSDEGSASPLLNLMCLTFTTSEGIAFELCTQRLDYGIYVFTSPELVRVNDSGVVVWAVSDNPNIASEVVCATLISVGQANGFSLSPVSHDGGPLQSCRSSQKGRVKG